MCLHCVQEPIAQAPMQADVSRTCSVLFYYARGSTRTYSGCGLVASRTHLGDSYSHLHLFPALPIWVYRPPSPARPAPPPH